MGVLQIYSIVNIVQGSSAGAEVTLKLQTAQYDVSCALLKLFKILIFTVCLFVKYIWA